MPIWVDGKRLRDGESLKLVTRRGKLRLDSEVRFFEFGPAYDVMVADMDGRELRRVPPGALVISRSDRERLSAKVTARGLEGMVVIGSERA